MTHGYLPLPEKEHIEWEIRPAQKRWPISLIFITLAVCLAIPTLLLFTNTATRSQPSQNSIIDRFFHHSCLFQSDCVQPQLVLAVLSTRSRRESRHLARLLWSEQIAQHEELRHNVRVVFAIGQDEETRALRANETMHDIAAEQLLYGDILQLDLPEGNTAFKIAEMYRKLDSLLPQNSETIVMKTDDDSYMNLVAVTRKLRTLMTKKMWLYGRRWPIEEKESAEHFKGNWNFTLGMGYALSRNLLHWMATDPLARDLTDSIPQSVYWLEDTFTGNILHRAGQEYTQIDEAGFMDVELRNNATFTGRFGWSGSYKDTILLHRLKTPELMKTHARQLMLEAEEWAKRRIAV